MIFRSFVEKFNLDSSCYKNKNFIYLFILVAAPWHHRWCFSNKYRQALLWQRDEAHESLWNSHKVDLEKSAKKFLSNSTVVEWLYLKMLDKLFFEGSKVRKWQWGMCPFLFQDVLYLEEEYSWTWIDSALVGCRFVDTNWLISMIFKQ